MIGLVNHHYRRTSGFFAMGLTPAVCLPRFIWWHSAKHWVDANRRCSHFRSHLEAGGPSALAHAGVWVVCWKGAVATRLFGGVQCSQGRLHPQFDAHIFGIEDADASAASGEESG